MTVSQIGAEIAAALELPEDGEIAIDELEADDADELFGIRGGQVVTPRNVAGRPVDQIEVFEQEFLVIHRASERGWSGG